MRFVCAYPAANLYLDAYRGHLAEMRDFGFTTVVVCVPESYLEYNLPAVRDLFAATHAAGLECWADPWGLAGIFDGEAPADPTRDPEAVIARWTEALGEAPEAARPDAIFWDNPRPAEPGAIAAWAARARGYGMGSQVCLSAFHHRDDLDLFRRVAELEVVDGIGTDPYCLGRFEAFDVERDVGRPARAVAEVAAAASRRSHVWVQGFGLPAGREDFPVQAAEAARTRGVDGIGFWAFRACEAWAGRPERPGEVWARFGAWLRRNSS